MSKVNITLKDIKHLDGDDTMIDVIEDLLINVAEFQTHLTVSDITVVRPHDGTVEIDTPAESVEQDDVEHIEAYFNKILSVVLDHSRISSKW